MRAFSLIVLLCAFAIPVAGCGGDDDNGGSGASPSGSADQTNTSGGGSASAGGGGGGGGQTLKLAADPNGALKFDKTSLSAKAGKVTILMTNDSPVPHAVEVEGHGVEKSGDTVQGGSGSSKVTANLKAGKYEFYCPVDGHKQAGMKGTLTVG
jgi:plastocyanin